MQIKTTLRYHLTPVRMAKIKTLRTVHVGEDVEQEEHFSTVGGNADWYNHYGKQDENYGRVVLNRHNSHDALDRKITERNEPKATLSRYRSDDMLDRLLDPGSAPCLGSPDQPPSIIG
ncbi:hypothetical protein STEG23_024429 [Scotinomys teguina]